jgi:hypothetical protein
MKLIIKWNKRFIYIYSMKELVGFSSCWKDHFKSPNPKPKKEENTFQEFKIMVISSYKVKNSVAARKNI